LADQDFSKFKKMVPPEVAILYNDLVKDVWFWIYKKIIDRSEN
jgi:hypothetical protein